MNEYYTNKDDEELEELKITESIMYECKDCGVLYHKVSRCTTCPNCGLSECNL